MNSSFVQHFNLKSYSCQRYFNGGLVRNMKILKIKIKDLMAYDFNIVCLSMLSVCWIQSMWFLKVVWFQFIKEIQLYTVIFLMLHLLLFLCCKMELFHECLIVDIDETSHMISCLFMYISLPFPLYILFYFFLCRNYFYFIILIYFLSLYILLPLIFS